MTGPAIPARLLLGRCPDRGPRVRVRAARGGSALLSSAGRWGGTDVVWCGEVGGVPTGGDVWWVYSGDV